MLELVNSERGKADLPPLALNARLSRAAEAHNDWMIRANKFQHKGEGGSDPTKRIRAAGYVLTGEWYTGENIAWTSPRRSIAGYQDEIVVLHTNLMNSTVHRKNILGKNFREIGLNLQIADRYQGSRGAALIGQTFGRSGPSVFLIGTVYVDKDNDGFYDPGEGVADVEIVATNPSGEDFRTSTNTHGAYKLILPPDEYRVSYRQGELDATKRVIVGNQNIKLDLLKSQVNATLAASRRPLQIEAARVHLAPGFTDRRPVKTPAAQGF